MNVKILFSLVLTVAYFPTAAHASVPLNAPPKAAPFSLHEVRLLPGPFKEGQDTAVKYLLSLEPDRFLANFRKEAGLKPKAKHYGGWESQGVSGHAGGHYLSACALAYASTGNRRLLERVNYIVDELAACQKANGNGYVAAIPNGKKVYAEVAAGQIRSAGFDLNGCWVPNYTLHKLFAGLRDAYRLCGNRQALAVAQGLADWMDQVHANLSEQQMQQILACEHGGLNETFADLYADTGEERYLKLSRKFHHHAILEPLARGEDILPGKHANTQIPKLIGLARRYEIAGDPNDRAAANFFWDRVVHHHSYGTGGHCDHEHFGQPDKLNDRLSPATTETCNVYNMLKLTRHVFGWNPDADVADFYERALLNHIRSTQHPDGRVIYNLSLKPGHHKEYQSPYDGFTCCVGTGFENHVKYGEGIYFHDADGLWVNLYLASELNWKARGLTLRQETKWPESDLATFTMTCNQPQEFTLRLRHPHWARSKLTIRINDQVQEVESRPSSYVTIRRVWKNGDRLSVQLPMSLYTEAMPDNAKRVAIFYGPTLLASDLGAVNDPQATEPFYVPALVVQDRPLTDWVKPVSPLTFKTDGVGKPRDVELVPFHRLHDRRYTVYLDLFTQADWTRRETEIRAEQERERQLTARTLDTLRIGEMQPERDHNLQGEKTSSGEHQGRKWRHATDGGWFSFELKADPAQSNELLCTYWGSDGNNRTFDILVNNIKVATQQLQNNKPGQFFEVRYSIPKDLTHGKEKVTVKFQAHPGKWAGGLFGVRMLRTENRSARAQFNFQHYLVDTNFPMFKNANGSVQDYGGSGLADFDRDGDLDFTFARPPAFGPSMVYWCEFQKPDQWVTHVAGKDAITSVGGNVMDVDGDGWMDIVHGGTWYRNTGRPRTEPFERNVFDPEGGSVHDVVIVDLDRDGRQDIITLSERNGLIWYRMPGFHKRKIADGVHGGVGPKGVGDLDGDGDLDLVRANIWIENTDGNGERWTEHPIPFGKDGPYGISTRSWIVDLDRDGDQDIVLCDCDRYQDAALVWLENVNRGQSWTKHELGKGVDFHALAVADFDRDGDADIMSCDSEVGDGPWKWYLWENLDGRAQRFERHIIFEAGLGGHDIQIGDIDGDGDLDVMSKPWSTSAKNAVGGKVHVDLLLNNTSIPR